MSRHRFTSDDRPPIPAGGAAEYACVCGKRGTYAVVERHVADNSGHDDRDERDERGAATTARYDQLFDNSDASSGGDTKAQHLPVEPHEPAPSTFMTRVELSLPPAVSDETCRRCGAGLPVADLTEIAAWSCGHWIRKQPHSIPEVFQDMLRRAFQGGVAAAAVGESFETWYQREVLQ